MSIFHQVEPVHEGPKLPVHSVDCDAIQWLPDIGGSRADRLDESDALERLKFVVSRRGCPCLDCRRWRERQGGEGMIFPMYDPVTDKILEGLREHVWRTTTVSDPPGVGSRGGCGARSTPQEGSVAGGEPAEREVEMRSLALSPGMFAGTGSFSAFPVQKVDDVLG